MKNLITNSILLLLIFATTTLTHAQWTQIGSDIDGEAAGDWSGGSVSLSSDGTIVAIGAVYNNGNGNNEGHVRVYGFTTGINENTISRDLSVYPNPTTNKVFVEITDYGLGIKDYSIAVFDIYGKEVFINKVKSQKTNIKNQKWEIDLSSQPKGIYIIKVRTDKGVSVGKVVKE